MAAVQVICFDRDARPGDGLSYDNAAKLIWISLMRQGTTQNVGAYEILRGTVSGSAAEVRAPGPSAVARRKRSACSYGRRAQSTPSAVR